MNIYRNFCESLYKLAVQEAKFRDIYIFFCLYVFFCFIQFTLFVYRSLIIVVENLQKYHWIQHEKMQSVHAEAIESLFIWQIHFIFVQIYIRIRYWVVLSVCMSVRVI